MNNKINKELKETNQNKEKGRLMISARQDMPFNMKMT